MKIKYFSRTLLSGMFVVATTIALAACGGGGGTEGGDDDGRGGDDESHYAGRDCMASGCHDSSIEADKRWSYAGTVYTDAGGTTAAVGATVTITQNDGTTIQRITDSLGNFYTRSGTPSAVYTASVNGGTAMVAKQTNGSCSASGCHGSGTLKIY